MLQQNKWLFFLVLCFNLFAYATPHTIIIVRHGEKLDDDHPDLSPQGCQRAFQLRNFFEPYRSSVAGIFAQQPNRAGGSIRPIETVAPTAKEFNLKVNNDYTKEEFKKISKDILNSPEYDGKTVIISWEHSAILELAPKLGVNVKKKLDEWPGTIFDQAWVLTYKHSDPNNVSLEIVAEHVLPTDIPESQSGVDNWGKENAPSNNGIIVPVDVVKHCENNNQYLDAIVREVVLAPIPGL
jgi:hypothetical protein